MVDFKIEQVILFASRTTDNYQEYSDVDLIVVGKFKGKNGYRRAVLLYLRWDMQVPDFLCYTPEEFNELKKKRTIVREAVKTGIEIT